MTAALVDAGWLREHLGDPGVAVVDCRWVLGRPGAGRQLYELGHVPGAAFLDVDTDLAAPPGEGGRHPLPDVRDFERAARRAGVSRGIRVVSYDDSGEGGAARLWWLLRHFGHDEAAVLDGGMRAWRNADGPEETGPPPERDGDFEARPRGDDVIEAAELREVLGDARLSLLDARAPARFAGEHEAIDPVAGHIPGARNVPYRELAPEGRYLPSGELRELLGGEDFVAYCGSGVTACTLLLAADVAGLSGGRLYPGSWSEWSGLGLPGETSR
ncbi:MAG: sulfurtransferase [Thermoleophilaceae bacterium]